MLQQPILLATDGSPSARRAAEFAVRLAAATGWPLHVVTVWHAPVTRSAFAPPVVQTHLAEAEREHAEFVLEATRAEAQAAGVEPVLHLRDGDAADEICTAALVHEAQVLVLGQHGWSRQRPPGGSVEEAVRRRAHCPVVVVPEETETAQTEPDEEQELAGRT